MTQSTLAEERRNEASFEGTGVETFYWRESFNINHVLLYNSNLTWPIPLAYVPVLFSYKPHTGIGERKSHKVISFLACHGNHSHPSVLPSFGWDPSLSEFPLAHPCLVVMSWWCNNHGCRLPTADSEGTSVQVWVPSSLHLHWRQPPGVSSARSAALKPSSPTRCCLTVSPHRCVAAVTRLPLTWLSNIHKK